MGILKDVRFYPILNFGHLGAPPSPLTFHNVKNHGGGGAEGEPGENCQGTENKRKQRKQHMEENQENRNKTTRKTLQTGQTKKVRVFLVKMSPAAEGQRRFQKNTAHVRSGI